MTLYYLNVTVHVLAALLWLGGMLFFAAVAAPVLRRLDPPDLRARLFQKLGEGFRLAGWVAIAVLLLTGVLNLHFRGWLSVAIAGDPIFWESRAGRAFMIKLACVLGMLAISAVHDFVFGPRASRAAPGSPEALALRKRAAMLARLNALIGVVLVYASVRLARGG